MCDAILVIERLSVVLGETEEVDVMSRITVACLVTATFLTLMTKQSHSLPNVTGTILVSL